MYFFTTRPFIYLHHCLTSISRHNHGSKITSSVLFLPLSIFSGSSFCYSMSREFSNLDSLPSLSVVASLFLSMIMVFLHFQALKQQHTLTSTTFPTTKTSTRIQLMVFSSSIPVRFSIVSVSFDIIFSNIRGPLPEDISEIS